MLTSARHQHAFTCGFIIDTEEAHVSRQMASFISGGTEGGQAGRLGLIGGLTYRFNGYIPNTDYALRSRPIKRKTQKPG